MKQQLTQIVSDNILPVAILMTARAADMVSTYHANPTFKFELNQWMKHAGWLRIILINVIVSLFIPVVLGRGISLMISFFSVFLAIRNYTIMPFSVGINEAAFADGLANYYSSTTGLNFWSRAIIKYILTFSIGLVIIIPAVKNPNLSDYKYISQGVIFYSTFIFVLDANSRIRFRKNK